MLRLLSKVGIWLGLVLLVGVAPVQAQMAHDGEANVTTVVAPADTTITIANKTSAGTNRVGAVACVLSVGSVVTANTWGGVTMGSPLVEATNATDGRTTYIWWFPAPPTSATNIVITTSAPVTAVCTASSYTGGHQTVQSGATNNASGTTSPATVDCTATANGVIVDSLYFIGAGTAPAVGADQTTNVVGSHDQGTWFGSSSRQLSASGNTMSWTLTSPTRWTTVCAALQPAGGGGGAVNCLGNLLGVGCSPLEQH